MRQAAKSIREFNLKIYPWSKLLLDELHIACRTTHEVSRRKFDRLAALQDFVILPLTESSVYAHLMILYVPCKDSLVTCILQFVRVSDRQKLSFPARRGQGARREIAAARRDKQLTTC
jgi:hypothetical protein